MIHFRLQRLASAHSLLLYPCAQLVMFDFEMDDACTAELHLQLMEKWIGPGLPAGLAPPPPPPPPPTDEPCRASRVHLDCCEEKCQHAGDGYCDDGGGGGLPGQNPDNTRVPTGGRADDRRGRHGPLIGWWAEGLVMRRMTMRLVLLVLLVLPR